MIKVEWNSAHTKKITKRYVNGKLESFVYNGLRYYPADGTFYCMEYDAFGNRYIGGDCCDKCELENECLNDKSGIFYNACSEFNLLCCYLIGTNTNKLIQL